MIKYTVALAFFFCATAKSQTYLSGNEKEIFSFRTKRGKYMMLAKDSAGKYIVYRFGTKEKVAFEYPEKNKSSWSKFKYAFYLRGGGIQNEGEDLNYIYFTNNNIRYRIYDEWVTRGNKSTLGIRVAPPSPDKPVDIEGDPKTRSGSLIDFRDNKLLEILEEPE